MSVLPVTERQFQAAVVSFARACSWKVCHFSDSRRQIAPGRMVGDHDAAGWPDLALARTGEFIVAELKTARGKVTAAQDTWLRTLTLAGVRTYVWRPSDWPEIERVLK